MNKISFSTFIKDPAKAYAMYERSIRKEVEKSFKTIMEERNAYKKTVKTLDHQNTQLREANKKHKETIKKLQEMLENSNE